ncbi:hypothetical protein BDN72DRAFT_962832 [Pluteus cervinus]|uniref:Uncharacterized protein n=1 Tax=Pluteus cervinus TaxID=181527 RepID=A0ACD3AHQ3_9AGAR|nr:hypothetical protein BDN72DRAFT_962832 [Pluteus cervinus]
MDTSPTLANPIFPLEIEHLIFTHGVEKRHLKPFPINLILVARRVYYWLCPIIYRTIRLDASIEYPIRWDHENLEKHGGYVRHLFIASFSSRLEMSPALPLSFCPNITHLMGWSFVDIPGMIEEIARLPLTHLSINLYEVNPTPILKKTLSKVTHLDNLGVFYDDDLALLDHFPSLTHLSTLGGHSAVTSLFEKLPKLKVVIFYDCHDSITRPVVQELNADEDHPMLVRMSRGTNGGFGDWFDDIMDRGGIWELAEEVIEKRKQ